MLGISTRLNLDNTEKSYLEELLFQLNTISRRAYQRVVKDKMSVHAIRKFAMNEGLTDHQAKSVVFQVEEWIAVDKANHKKYQEDLQETIQGIEKNLKTLKSDRDKLESKTSLTKKQKVQLEKLKQMIFHKHRRRCNLQKRLDNLETKPSHRVFGGKKLLSQRSRMDIDTPDKESLDTWKLEWKGQRNQEFIFVGGSVQSWGNQSTQIDLVNKVLILRLTETQANERIQAEAERINKPFEKVPQRLKLKRLEIPVNFEQESLLRQAQALKLPITVQIKQKFTPKGERHRRQKKALTAEDYAYYLHASFNLPTPPVIHQHTYGVLGVDQNSWGLSWCIIKFDGNMASHNGKHLKGDIPIHKNGKTKKQIEAQVHEAVKTLTDLAERFHCAIALEDLNFSKARNQSREKGKRYAKMVHALNTAKIKESMRSRCRKRGIALHLIDPAWTSVSGYVKFGVRNNLSVDQAAGMTIARKALLGKHWKPFYIPTWSIKKHKPISLHHQKEMKEKQENTLFEQTIYFKESVNTFQSFPELDQRINFGSLGWTWKDWQKVLGKDRTLWHEKLTSFPTFLLSLEANPATAKKSAPWMEGKSPTGKVSARGAGECLALPGLLKKQTPIRSSDLMNG